MFRIQETQEYDWPVDIQVPVDGGAFTRRRFTARFRVMDKDRYDELLENPAEMEEGVLREVLVGWADGEIQSAAGDTLDWSPENRDRLLKIPYVRTAVMTAYVDSISGRKPKN